MSGPIPLFNGYKYDNPRTEDEISYVAEMLKKSCSSAPFLFWIGEKENVGMCRFPIEIEDVLPLAIYKMDFNSTIKEQMSALISKDKEESYLAIASFWVILRFDYEYFNSKEGQINRFVKGTIENEQYSEHFDGKELWIERKKIEKIRCKIENQMSLLSFMHGSNYLGSVFQDETFDQVNANLLTNFTISVSPFFNMIQMFLEDISFFQKRKKCDFIVWYDSIFNEIHSINLEQKFDKIDFISDSLQPYFIPSLDYRSKLLCLVSVLELLLVKTEEGKSTDDSITKQFTYNSLAILHISSSKDKPDYFKNEKSMSRLLSKAYAIRSSIAHGNFQKEKEIIQTLIPTLNELYESQKKRSKVITLQEEISPCLEMLSILEIVLRIVLQEYFKDKSFFSIIKKDI